MGSKELTILSETGTELDGTKSEISPQGRQEEGQRAVEWANVEKE